MSTSESAPVGPVVAGFDGSEQARSAVLWAAGEAASRRHPLVVVQVVGRAVLSPLSTPLAAGPPLPPSDFVEQERVLRESAERQVADLVAECGRRWPGLETTSRVESGRAAEVLANAGAELVVIGASGRTGLSRMLLGSTAARLVQSYEGPIVVVRPAEDVPTGGPVVVGVDGSPTSGRAVAFAFGFASRHQGELVAVHAWSDLPVDALEPVRAWDEDWDAVRENGERVLAESLDRYQERYPDVSVRRVVSFDRPAHTLIEHAEGASLLVVGSHGRGAMASVLLGSVSHAVLYHAPCPVAILRSADMTG